MKLRPDFLINSEPVTVWEGKHLRVRQCGHWEYVERTKARGGVVIVAVTDDQKLLLVEQYRVPMGKSVIELPAGLAGDVEGCETEELMEAARRELLEETGYEAHEMIVLMAAPSSPGLTNEVNTMFRAGGVRYVARGGGDEQEQIKLHAVPLHEVHGWLHQKMEEGLGVDPKVYAGLYFLDREPERGHPGRSTPDAAESSISKSSSSGNCCRQDGPAPVTGRDESKG